jgi:DNA-binding transcriptional LysR family regulator
MSIPAQALPATLRLNRQQQCERQARFHAGVRLGEQVAKDMIAVRIAPDLRMAIVGSPTYFSKRKPPKTPHDLASHDCINLRLPNYGGLYAWEFKKNGHELNVRVQGQLVFNSSVQILSAALAGFGMACIPEDMVQEHIAEGRLRRVIEEWCPTFPGYHLYYARLSNCEFNRPTGRSLQPPHPG